MRNDKEQLIEEKIEMLQTWIAALEDIKRGKSEASTLKERNINKRKFRNFLFYGDYADTETQELPNKVVLINGAERIYAEITEDYNLSAVPGDIEEVIAYCLENTDLTFRTRNILKSLYEENLTLEETGEMYGITKERVRQIKEKSLFKIKRKHRLILKYGMLGHKVAMLEAKKRDLELQDALSEREQEFKERKIKENLYLALPFPEFAYRENLSARVINAISRSQYKDFRVCDFETISLKELKDVWFLGKNGQYELLAALMKHGIIVGSRQGGATTV